MINKALVTIRKYHDIQVKEMAELLHITKYHLSNIELGHRYTNSKHLERYSGIFNVPANDIVIFAQYLSTPEEFFQFEHVGNKIKRIARWLIDAQEVNQEHADLKI